ASIEEALTALRPVMDEIDGFEQSLNAGVHRDIANLFLRQQPGLSLDELARNIWPSLILNGEAAAGVAQAVADHRAGALVRQGLAARYDAVNKLLDDGCMTLPERVQVGADAILVVPTLAYYASVFADKVRPLENFTCVLESGLLNEALYDAAVLVRLLNDLGTQLLMNSTDSRAEVLRSLRADGKGGESFYDLLRNAPEQYRRWLTRIRKDLTHGEFNISVYSLNYSTNAEMIDAFKDQLDYLSRFYMQTRAQLIARLHDMRSKLGDPTISALLERFVAFHEKLYSNNYEEAEGEYAV
ncbi:MAG TPA: hypothetical protein VMT34_11540, partial [Aggregatilineales bacterium]|nr:hypothetical protein [Aggregatilineales bacterium]